MYKIIDDYGTVIESETVKSVLKKWIIKEIESIMDTVDENDYHNALMVVSLLYQYELKEFDAQKQFNELARIISDYEDAKIAYGTKFLGWV